MINWLVLILKKAAKLLEKKSLQNFQCFVVGTESFEVVEYVLKFLGKNWNSFFEIKKKILMSQCCPIAVQKNKIMFLYYNK